MAYTLQVNVHRRPNLLDPDFEFLQYQGIQTLKTIFVKEEVDPTVTHLELWFPERWLNIIQERSLYQRFDKFLPNLQSVVIDTQSVYILQCTSSKDMRILISKEEQDHTEANGLVQETDSGVSSFRVVGLPNFSSLHFMYGSGK